MTIEKTVPFANIIKNGVVESVRLCTWDDHRESGLDLPVVGSTTLPVSGNLHIDSGNIVVDLGEKLDYLKNNTDIGFPYLNSTGSYQKVNFGASGGIDLTVTNNVFNFAFNGNISNTLNLNDNLISNIQAPQTGGDAINLTFLNSSIESAITSAVNTSRDYVNNRIIPINKLANYPNNATKVLYGDGLWRTLNLPSNIATTTYVDTTVANHIVQIDKLAGYQNNSALVLKGDGTWGSINSFSSSIDMNNNRITELGTPVHNTDAVNKSYIDNRIIPINKLSGYAEATNRSTSVLKADGTWSTISDIIVNLDMNNNRISNLANPSSLTDAVNQSYVVNRTIPISQLASYPNNSSYLLKGNGTWGTFTPDFTSYSSTYNIPVNNTYSSATETGFDIQNNGVSGLKIGHNNSSSWSYLKSRSTIEYYVQSAGSYSVSMKMWATGISLENNRIFNLADPVSSTDAANKNYVDSAISSGGGGNPLDALEVNVNGVYTNWLKRGGYTKTNVTIYGQNAGSFIFEHKSGESCGLAVNGDSDGCTIWSPGDSGAYLNIQDEDSDNSRKAYVNTSGNWVSVSSQKRKHSIRDKNNNDVLSRFMNVKIKTYGHVYDAGKFKKKQVDRIARKSKEMATGLILEDLFDIFPNCISDYRNELFQKKEKKKKLSLEKEVKDIKNAGVDYNTLMCYFIMAFQEFVEKTNNKIEQLEAKND